MAKSKFGLEEVLNCRQSFSPYCVLRVKVTPALPAEDTHTLTHTHTHTHTLCSLSVQCPLSGPLETPFLSLVLTETPLHTTHSRLDVTSLINISDVPNIDLVTLPRTPMHTHTHTHAHTHAHTHT